MPQAEALVMRPWRAPGLLLLALAKIPAGWNMLSVLYLAPQPETFEGRYWCARPDPGIAPQQWIESRHPKSTKQLNGYDPCYINEPEDENNIIYRSAASNFSLSACEDFEFEMPHQTMVSEFSLVCHRDVLVNVIQLSYLIGILLGGISTWLLIKRISPRIILLSGATLHMAAGIGSALVPLFEQHCVLKFLTGLGVCLMFTSGFQISQDITSGWQKTAVGVCYEHFWSIGVISLGWLNELSESWRILQLVISAPTILILFFFWALPESPLWLIAHGRAAHEEIREAAAHVNKQKLLHNFSEPNANGQTSKSAASLPKLKIFCSQILWIVTVVNYYGALLNIRSVGGTSLAIRTTLAGGAELIGASIGLYLLLWSKHKFGFLSALLLTGGTCCISSWALPSNGQGNKGSWAMVWLALTGRVAIACSLALLSNGATTDFLPSPKRPLAMMVFVSIGRLCLQGAPFMNSLADYYTDAITLSIYGSLIVIGAVAAFMLFLQNECGERRKPKRRSTNLMHSPQGRVCHVHQTGASCPDTST